MDKPVAKLTVSLESLTMALLMQCSVVAYALPRHSSFRILVRASGASRRFGLPLSTALYFWNIGPVYLRHTQSASVHQYVSHSMGASALWECSSASVR